ncbi:MAG TPA: PKD domain-containing protein, partial [Candidatus Dormibacteraeota bacterium]|nr:PKD domain-containing protein [Candidatus Dormibacteraeota bacterium]
ITGTSVSPSLFVIPRENVSFSGSFSDAAAMDSHVATWDFGDGSNATENIVAGGSTDLNASHSYAAAGTYTVRLKVADDDGTAGVATTTLTVMTPQQALGLLASYVENLPGLNAGEKNSLLVKLNAASDALTRGDATAAGNELNAFLNELNADLSSGKVSRDSASVLSASVHVVQSALGTRNRFTDLWPLGL